MTEWSEDQYVAGRRPTESSRNKYSKMLRASMDKVNVVGASQFGLCALIRLRSAQQTHFLSHFFGVYTTVEHVTRLSHVYLVICRSAFVCAPWNSARRHARRNVLGSSTNAQSYVRLYVWPVCGLLSSRAPRPTRIFRGLPAQRAGRWKGKFVTRHATRRLFECVECVVQTFSLSFSSSI